MVLPKVPAPSVRPQPIWVLSAILMQRIAGAASGSITWRAAAGAGMHWPSPHVQLHGAIDSVLQDSTSKRALADRCCGQKCGRRAAPPPAYVVSVGAVRPRLHDALGSVE